MTESEAIARKLLPWGAVFIKVEGGFDVYESVEDARRAAENAKKYPLKPDNELEK